MIKISPKSYLNLQSKIFSFLLLAHLFSYLLAAFYPNYKDEFSIFNFDYETNIPTLYSSINFLIISFLSYTIFYKTKMKGFVFISISAIYAALDETSRFHERISVIILEYLHIPYGWIYLYGFFIIIFFLKFKNFFKSFNLTIRRFIILSIFTFLTGSMILEFIVHKFYFIPESLWANIFCTVEESLEMIGTILFSYALLRHIKESLKLKYLIKI